MRNIQSFISLQNNKKKQRDNHKLRSHAQIRQCITRPTLKMTLARLSL
jgi:hypothetical protein